MKLFITSDLNLGYNDAEQIRNVILSSSKYRNATKFDVLILLGDLASIAALAEPSIEGALTMFESFPGKKLLVVGNQDLGLDQQNPKFGANLSLNRYNEWFSRVASRHNFTLLDEKSIRIGNVGFVGGIGPITADEILAYPPYHALSTDLPTSIEFENLIYERFVQNLENIRNAEVIVAAMHFPPLIPKPEKFEKIPSSWSEYPKKIKGRTVLTSRFWKHFIQLEIPYVFCASFHYLFDWGPIYYTRSEAGNLRFLWVEIPTFV